MGVKSFLLRLYAWPISSKEKFDKYQKIARDAEWEALKPYIKPGKFFDLGCGTGYAMIRANDELGVDAYGIDPDPYQHGVINSKGDSLKIKKGFAEDIPFEDEMFDTVFSSHVLEHVVGKEQALKEIDRILKPDGVLIIGMPTATMALISLVSQYILLTPYKIFNVLFGRFVNANNNKWWEIFIPQSHSTPIAKTIVYDLIYYREKNWKKIIERGFKIERVLHPALYPYPDYRQLFKLKKLNSYSSSVFFICKKIQK